MADFCKQCSIVNFGEDYGDLAGLITPEEVVDGYVASVLCEGCGDTFVNHEGICVSPNCIEKHGMPKNKEKE